MIEYTTALRIIYKALHPWQGWKWKAHSEGLHVRGGEDLECTARPEVRGATQNFFFLKVIHSRSLYDHIFM